MFQHTSSLAFRALLKVAASRAGLDQARPAHHGPDCRPPRPSMSRPPPQDTPVVLVVPTDADVEQLVGRRPVLSCERCTGCVRRGRRARRAAVPVTGSRSVPRPGAAPRSRVGARPRAASASRRARPGSSSRPRARCCRGCRTRRAWPTPALSLAPGDEIAPSRSRRAALALAGFAPEDPVDEHGEFCVRGGVVDFYPASDAQPVRLEFIGDIVESIRRFDAATQRSLTALDRVDVTPQRELLPDDARPDDPARLRSHRRRSSTTSRRAGASLARVRAGRCHGARPQRSKQQWRSRRDDLTARGRVVPAVRDDRASAWDASGRLARRRGRRRSASWPIERTASAGTWRVRPAAAYHGRIGDWAEEIRAGARARATASCSSPRRPAAPSGRSSCSPTTTSARGRSTDTDDLETRRRARDDRPAVARLSSAGRQPPLFAETDLFEEERRAHERRRSASRTFLSDFRDLKVGDLVVHVDNGIGRFVGLKKLAVGAGQERAGVHGAALRRRRQAVRPARAARPRPEVHRRRRGRARQAGRHHLGKGQDARQEGHARHGRGAAQALRRAQGRRRATRSAPTRTGSRNSPTRSSTT